MLKSVHFEVFGKVQGVFFRKCTRDIALEYGLVGWVKNTSKARGNVVGVAQGAEPKINQIKVWLCEIGSPKSRIDRCVFCNEVTIERTQYDTFTIRR